MHWFRRGKKGIKATPGKRDMPEGVWIKCDECSEILYRPEMEKSFWTCGKCGYHFRIPAMKHVELLLDEGSFEEQDANLSSEDALTFKDSKKYPDRLTAAVKPQSINVLVGEGYVNV